MTQNAAVALLRGALAALTGSVVLAGRVPAARRAGDPPEKIVAVPRLMIMLAGSQRIGYTHHGQRREAVLGAGDALHYAANAWDLHHWGGRSRFAAAVYHRSFIRVLDVDYAGAPAPMPPARWLHTDLPIDAVGRGLIAALDAAADGGCGAAVLRGTFRALVEHTLDQVARSDPSRGGGAARTWRAIMDVLAERANEPLTREQAAAAVGIHPGYLSALCSSHGRSYRRALEDVRCERAARMLRERDAMPIQRIAALCGYSSASAFIRMFRRVTGSTPGERRGGE